MFLTNENGLAELGAQQAMASSAQTAYQTYMSDTAHQREMYDLKAAGLNPVLSAKLGGASTPSGESGLGSVASKYGMSVGELVDAAANAAAGATAKGIGEWLDSSWSNTASSSGNPYYSSEREEGNFKTIKTAAGVLSKISGLRWVGNILNTNAKDLASWSANQPYGNYANPYGYQKAKENAYKTNAIVSNISRAVSTATKGHVTLGRNFR